MENHPNKFLLHHRFNTVHLVIQLSECLTPAIKMQEMYANTMSYTTHMPLLPTHRDF